MHYITTEISNKAIARRVNIDKIDSQYERMSVRLHGCAGNGKATLIEGVLKETFKL